MHGEEGSRVSAEPVADLAEGGGVRVVEVLARGKQLDALGARSGQRVEQAGVQARAQEYMCRDNLQHRGGVQPLSSHFAYHLPARQGSGGHVATALMCPGGTT